VSDESSRIGASDGDTTPSPDPGGDDGSAFTAAEEALAEARRRVAEAPVEDVVTNHAMGLYELAAIHLSSEQPDFAAASLAIDALGALVDGLGDRLGREAPTLRDALANIRLVYVQLKKGPADGSPEGSD
jgi:hypothetical protein